MFYRYLKNKTRHLFGAKFYQDKKELRRFRNPNPLKKEEKRKGEAATILTLIAVGIMTLGIFAGTKLSQEKTDIRSKAADTTCWLTNQPQLVKEGNSVYCDVKIDNPPNPPPTRINCTLINPNQASNGQILTDSVFYRWYSASESPGSTLRFQLTKNSSFDARLTPAGNYRLVSYRLAEDWTTSLCDKTKDYTDLSPFFGATSAPTPPAQPTATRIPTPTTTPTPVIPQCEKDGIGICATDCSDLGGLFAPASSPYGCNLRRSNETCCINYYTTPPPTWTPVPTQRPTLTPTPTPTPTRSAGQTATSTPTPPAGQIPPECGGIISVSAEPQNVGLNSNFKCNISYDKQSSPYNMVCGLQRDGTNDHPQPSCKTANASGGHFSIPCSSGGPVADYVDKGGNFRLVAFRNIDDCTKKGNPSFALGVVKSNVFTINQQSASQQVQYVNYSTCSDISIAAEKSQGVFFSESGNNYYVPYVTIEDKTYKSADLTCQKI